ncbi:MAG: hypothetical protein KC620_23305, partial [Myxococcales bacterium]|nr:hypothetical protein [Myxococcales bacterium]
TRRLGRAPPARGLWLRAVPIGGWLFLLLGLLLPFEHPALWAIWWIDAFLSVIVHGIQLVPALPRGRRAGYPRWQTVLYTFLFGATWWKRLDPPTASPPRLS